MGKTGKWILNFLIGKKEEKLKNKKKKMISSSFSSENLITSDSQNMKLRWSFRKTTGNLITQKASNSIDSVDTNQALKKPIMAEDKAKQKQLFSHCQNAAALKIQSVYRSHLARKALHALRGLVKIQALVRGHLVRKQIAATLKSMQALMAIQVRARVNRILMAEDERHLERRRLSNQTHFNELWRPYRSRSSHISHSDIDKIENKMKTHNYRTKISVSRRHQLRHYSDSVPHNQSFYPSYMAKTESSSAKVRSHSEPKQRPGSGIRPKSEKTEIPDGINFRAGDRSRNSLEDLKGNGYENHNHPWFMKLYQMTKTSKNGNGDSVDNSSMFHTT